MATDHWMEQVPKFSGDDAAVAQRLMRDGATRIPEGWVVTGQPWIERRDAPWDALLFPVATV